MAGDWVGSVGVKTESEVNKRIEIIGISFSNSLQIIYKDIRA